MHVHSRVGFGTILNPNHSFGKTGHIHSSHKIHKFVTYLLNNSYNCQWCTFCYSLARKIDLLCDSDIFL